MMEFLDEDGDPDKPKKTGTFSPKNMILLHVLETLVDNGVIKMVPVKEEKSPRK